MIKALTIAGLVALILGLIPTVSVFIAAIAERAKNESWFTILVCVGCVIFFGFEIVGIVMVVGVLQAM